MLLVVLIFLMLSTTYSKFTEIQLKLPVADADAQRDYAKELIVAISADGSYSVNRTPVAGRSMESVPRPWLNPPRRAKTRWSSSVPTRVHATSRL